MKVLVTGANGHVGYNLCQALLAREGYQVRASVRSLDDEAKVAPLRALGDVEIVALNIRDAAQFDAALAGIDVLFHVAATYAIYTQTGEQAEEIVKDSVEGVEIALSAAAKLGVKKVVLTSSVVALPLVTPDAPPVTEADWRTDFSVPYYRAKTEAEQAAWRLSEELGVPLVTVLPGGVAGPGFVRRTPTIDLFEGIMLGSLRMGAPWGNFTYVDARDVAMGHILAAEKDVSGRFILCDDVQPTWTEFSSLMHEIDPEVPAAPWELPKFMGRFLPFFDGLSAKRLGSARVVTPDIERAIRGRVWRVSSERAKQELGWTIGFPMRESMRDTMAAIRALRRSEGKKVMA